MSNPPPNTAPRQALTFQDIEDLITNQLMEIEVTPYPNKGAKLEAQMTLAFGALNEIMFSLRVLQQEKKIVVS